MEIVADNYTIASSGSNVTYTEAACNGSYIPSLIDPNASDQQVLDGLASFIKLYLKDIEPQTQGNDGDHDPLWAWQVTF